MAAEAQKQASIQRGIPFKNTIQTNYIDQLTVFFGPAGGVLLFKQLLKNFPNIGNEKGYVKLWARVTQNVNRL